MVKGLDRFRSAFAAHPDAFVLIGGTACHLAMAQVGATFRTTHDLDIVLCPERMDADFAHRLRMARQQHPTADLDRGRL